MFESPPRRALYTVMIVDEGIERLEGKQFIHWLVTNVPGSDVGRGAEVMQYIPPFSIELGSDGAIDKTKSHPMLALIYREVKEDFTLEFEYRVVHQAPHYKTF